MKTLYLTDSSANIWIDTDNGTSGSLGTVDRYDMRNIFLIEEPMHVIYNYGEEHIEMDVKKGDLLATFYTRDSFKHKIGVLKSKEWRENIIAYNKAQQKAKEEWAAKQASTIDTPCCDSCENCKSC